MFETEVVELSLGPVPWAPESLQSSCNDPSCDPWGGGEVLSSFT